MVKPSAALLDMALPEDDESDEDFDGPPLMSHCPFHNVMYRFGRF